MDEYVEITTLSHFKLKYVLPVDVFERMGFSEPIDQKALLDCINAGEFKEFSQKHLGEVIADVNAYTEEDMLEIFDKDNEYLINWPLERKIAYLKNWQG